MTARLAQNERAQRDFFASITHELRTPLALLQGTLENMTAGVTEPTPERLFAMQEEIMRLNRLVTDLRDLSLAQAHELRLHLRPTDLGQLAQQCTMLIQPLLDEKEQMLQCQIPEHLPRLMLDADRMRQVVGNLLVNASRHSRSGSHIRLTSASSLTASSSALPMTGHASPQKTCLTSSTGSTRAPIMRRAAPASVSRLPANTQRAITARLLLYRHQKKALFSRYVCQRLDTPYA